MSERNAVQRAFDQFGLCQEPDRANWLSRIAGWVR